MRLRRSLWRTRSGSHPIWRSCSNRSPRSRLLLDDDQRQVAAAILFGYLEDRSAIVRACALEALVRLAEGDPALQVLVAPTLEAALRDDTPAERSRVRRVRAG
jgi:hypothetical protein